MSKESDLELKEAVRKYRSLANKVDFSSQRGYKKPNKKTISEIFDFRNDINYPRYLEVSTKKIQEIQDNSLKNYPENVKNQYDQIKPLLKDCEIEEKIKSEIKDKIREIEKKYSKVRNEQDIKWNTPEDRELNEKENIEKDLLINMALKKVIPDSGIKPCDALYKAVEEIKKENNLDPYGSGIKSNLQHYYYNMEHLCVITPNLDENSIKNSECNYQYGIEKFIESFKEEEREKKKETEWFRKFVTNENAKKYFESLNKIVDVPDVRNEIKTQYTEDLRRQTEFAKDIKEDIERKFEEINNDNSLTNNQKVNKRDKIYKQYKSAKFIVDRYWDEKNNNFNEKIINYEATTNTNDTIIQFVRKNTEKLSSILSRREDCKDFEQTLRVGQGIIEGDINVKCSNGDSFRVNNQMVYVPEGEKRSHYRFPTTFHDIKSSDGFVKMESEEWMNKRFAKKEK